VRISASISACHMQSPHRPGCLYKLCPLSLPSFFNTPPLSFIQKRVLRLLCRVQNNSKRINNVRKTKIILRIFDVCESSSSSPSTSITKNAPSTWHMINSTVFSKSSRKLRNVCKAKKPPPAFLCLQKTKTIQDFNLCVRVFRVSSLHSNYQNQRRSSHVRHRRLF